MFGFPVSTEFNKRIPKQKFYENIEVSPAVKRIFVEQIHIIYWRNKLAAATLNLAAGDAVTEIEIFEVKLNTPQLDEAVLRQIDKAIPYHILFVLTYEGKAQAWIGYKEASSGGNAFKVNRYYHTDWMPENELQFTISGLNMDAVYESLVRQIAGERLQAAPNESLKVSVGRDEARRRLEKQIAALENAMRKEKQLNRKMEGVGQLIMLIKFGQEQHMVDLRDKGAMFFNPIKKFRELEEEQKKKGIGDANDGSIHATAEKAWISQSNKMAVLNNANISVITDPALKIPAYCLCKTETEYISAIYREKLREQFPEHTHALIIEDEEEFLEQVRYRFRNKAFAHDIFYQDDFLLDFWNFLKCGQSDIMFYKPNAKKRYYSEMLFEHNSGTREYLRIDDSNFYRTAFRKDIFFSDQKEFRIVLPHEKIIAGKIYEVGAIRSTLVKIDDLVKD